MKNTPNKPTKSGYTFFRQIVQHFPRGLHLCNRTIRESALDEIPGIGPAKKRIIGLDEKRRKIVSELSKDNKKEEVSVDLKNIMHGASDYLLRAYEENDETKSGEEANSLYKQAYEKYK
ncbi:MAG: hypothetical protein PF904_08740 [Kiritimatiellae bacterium]|jgi:hypothetical protein|nr:hypothetical protein [Kiritimatiellia bacterium]